MRGNAARAFGLGVAVVGLVSIVAIAARGATPEGTGAVRPPSRTLLDTFFSLSLVAVVLGGALLLYGLAQRKAIAREVATGRYRRTTLVSGTSCGSRRPASSGTGSRGSSGCGSGRAEEQDPAFPDAELAPRPQDESGTAYTAQFTWVPVVVVAALIVAAVVAYYVADRRAARSRPLDENARRATRSRARRHAGRPSRGSRSAPRRDRRVRAARARARRESRAPASLRDAGGATSQRVLRQLDLEVRTRSSG